MKRKVTSIVISVMCTLLVICSGCSCSSCAITETQKIREYSITDGYFKYYYLRNENCYAIVGDGDVPYSQELTIPAYYKGKNVKYVFYSADSIYFGGCFGTSLKNVETVYFSYLNNLKYGYEVTHASHNPCKVYGPKKIFIVNNEDLDKIAENFEERGERCFYTRKQYDKRLLLKRSLDYIKREKGYKTKFERAFESDILEDFSIQVANTSYMFNYSGAPNDGYFFINEFERGGLIKDTPYEPIRAGYKFGGWYKEPECETKWDFATDKLPEAEYDEDGDVTEYIETKLYAKWIWTLF